MHKDEVDIKFGFLFPWPFLFLAGLMSIVAIFLLADKTLVAVILLLGSIFVLTAYVGTEIDKKNRVYREYNAFFFIKSGKRTKYAGIERIFINRSIKKQRLYTAHTNQSSVFSNEEFNAYLKFIDGTKILLLSKRDKKKLLRALEDISNDLQAPVVDNTISS